MRQLTQEIARKVIEFREDRCKGCSLCMTVCPKQIITMSPRFNTSGYKVVEVLEEHLDQCTSCAACALICPDCAVLLGPRKRRKKGEPAHVREA